jgi:hypothetical protein
MRTIFIILLSFLLTACGTAAPAMPASTVTVITLPTATYTPAPTASATPTPALPPEFTALGLDSSKYVIDGKQIKNIDDGLVIMVQDEEGKWVEFVTLPSEVVKQVNDQLPAGWEIVGDRIMDANGNFTGLQADHVMFEGEDVAIIRRGESDAFFPSDIVDLGEGDANIPGYIYRDETGSLERLYLSSYGLLGESFGQVPVISRAEQLAIWSQEADKIREKFGLGEQDLLPDEFAPVMTPENGLAKSWYQNYVATNLEVAGLMELGQDVKYWSVTKPDLPDKDGNKREIEGQFPRMMYFSFVAKQEALGKDMENLPSRFVCSVMMGVDGKPIISIVNIGDDIQSIDEARLKFMGELPWVDPSLDIELK